MFLRHAGSTIGRTLRSGVFLLAVLQCSRSAQAEALFCIPDQRVLPGQQGVWFPLLLTSDEAIQGFQVNVTFDPRFLELNNYSLDYTVTARAGAEFFEVITTNSSVEAGVIVDFLAPFTNTVLSPVRGGRLLNLIVDVRADAPVGERTRVEFVPPEENPRILNLVTINNFGRRPALKGATVEIVSPEDPQAVLFVRGDADASGDLALADAISVLNFLFLSGSAPRCLDAADFNDTGELDISSAVSLLFFLYLGGPPPAVPFPNAGLDPTADSLRCR